MAVIGKIRKQVGLIIIFVGVSLVLFILGDLVTNNSGMLGGSSSDVIAEIGGEKVRYLEFERKVEQLTESYKLNSQQDNIEQGMSDMLREQAWSTTVNELVLGTEYKKMGLSCSADELYDMVAGNNPHQQVIQAFTNRETGQFNREDVIRFLKNLPNAEEKIQLQWKNFEDAIREERIAEKYKSIMEGGLYVTTAEAKQNYLDAGRLASLKYVRVDINSIPDSAVKAEESDLKAYYNEHKNEYKQDETVRSLDYVVFDVKPSDEDKAVITEWINEKKKEFETEEDAPLFVAQNSDAAFDSTYKQKGVLTPALDTTLFNAPVGTIIGPYIDQESYKVAKLIAVRMMADSVKARHILIKLQNNDSVAARSKADSIKTVIKKGQKFEDLALRFSEDPGSAVKGGDLGWFRQGAMVPSFNDACFHGNKGDMPIVVSEFGVHLIEIMDKGALQKEIQVAIVERKIEPSQKTYDKVYQEAQQFAAASTTAEEFDSTVIKQGLNKRIADNIRERDKTVAGLDQPRELVRWAYNNKVSKGDVSKVFTFGDKFVVAKLTGIREKGFLPLDEVREQVKSRVLKNKKAEKISEDINARMQGSDNIDALAGKLNQQVQTADNVNFTNSYIPNAGNEPRIVGTVFTLKENQLSKPVKGEQAVYVLLVEKFTEPMPQTDFTLNQTQLTGSRKRRADSESFNALKEKANIEDNRGRFY